MSRKRRERQKMMADTTDLERTLASVPASPPKTLRQLARDLKEEVSAVPEPEPIPKYSMAIQKKEYDAVTQRLLKSAEELGRVVAMERALAEYASIPYPEGPEDFGGSDYPDPVLVERPK